MLSFAFVWEKFLTRKAKQCEGQSYYALWVYDLIVPNYSIIFKKYHNYASLSNELINMTMNISGHVAVAFNVNC